MSNRLLRVSLQRKILAVIVSIAAVIGLLWVVDSVLAIRAEKVVAATADAGGQYLSTPQAYLGGFPFVSNLWSGKIPDLAIEAKEAEVPGWGLLNARITAEDVELSPADVLDGALVGAPTKEIIRRIGLDGAAVGRQIGMHDLYITNPDDLSPRGGPSSKAQLKGTPPGFEDPVTVTVSLLLTGPEFTITPISIEDAPKGQEDAINKAFTWSFDTHSLPLDGPADRVSLNGGSLYFEEERHFTTMSAADLSPLGGA